MLKLLGKKQMEDEAVNKKYKAKSKRWVTRNGPLCETVRVDGIEESKLESRCLSKRVFGFGTTKDCEGKDCIQGVGQMT